MVLFPATLITFLYLFHLSYERPSIQEDAHAHLNSHTHYAMGLGVYMLAWRWNLRRVNSGERPTRVDAGQFGKVISGPKVLATSSPACFCMNLSYWFCRLYSSWRRAWTKERCDRQPFRVWSYEPFCPGLKGVCTSCRPSALAFSFYWQQSPEI